MRLIKKIDSLSFISGLLLWLQLISVTHGCFPKIGIQDNPTFIAGNPYPTLSMGI